MPLRLVCGVFDKYNSISHAQLTLYASFHSFIVPSTVQEEPTESSTDPYEAVPAHTSPAAEAPAPITASVPTTPSSAPTTSSSQSAAPPPTAGREWLAGCEYVPPEGSNDKLGFEQGDVLLVLNELPGGWWFARLHDREGWIPSDFMDPMPDGSEGEEDPEAADDDDLASDYVPAADMPTGPPAAAPAPRGDTEEDDDVAAALAAISNAGATLSRLGGAPAASQQQKNDRARLENVMLLGSPAAHVAPSLSGTVAGSPILNGRTQNGGGGLMARSISQQEDDDAPPLPPKGLAAEPQTPAPKPRQNYEDMSDATPVNMAEAEAIERRATLSRHSSSASGYAPMMLRAESFSSTVDGGGLGLLREAAAVPATGDKTDDDYLEM